MQMPVDPRLQALARAAQSMPNAQPGRPQPVPPTVPAQPATQNNPSPAPIDDEAPFDDDMQSAGPLITWEAPEYEKNERERNWYFIVFGALILLVGYALFTDSLLMAIVFIMVAVLIYLFETKDTRIITFGITYDGVFAQDRMYEFISLEHFWIFYEPGGKRILSLKSNRSYLPYIQMPIGDTDPSAIREVLIQFIPEQRHEEGPFDWLERFF